MIDYREYVTMAARSNADADVTAPQTPRPAAGVTHQSRRNMADGDPAARAREHFLRDDNRYGCAESTYLATKEAFGLGGDRDSSPAMALNGGIAYSGGTCGAITGAALALGMLADRRLGEHAAAKRAARDLTMWLMDCFLRDHGSLNCRDLIEMDLRAPGVHAEFLASGIWRTRCMAQIESVVRALAPLGDEGAWEAALTELGIPGADDAALPRRTRPAGR
jgi:C_GCAxxG_C_C family probable redox protein